MATVDRLYELFNVISEAGDASSKHEAEFEEIVTGAKGGSGEKRLASQFIARFYHLFTNQQDQALNALFDLCEDNDISIRKQAVKDLPTLCRNKPEIIAKVADIFAQLLIMDDPAELNAVQAALVTLIKLDAKETLTGLFFQIENSTEDQVRERCMKFILAKMDPLGSDVFKTDVEELILKEAKTVFTDAAEEEFILMMSILRKLKICKTIKGYQQLVDLVSEQCDLSQPLIPSDVENAQRVVSCIKQAVPYFSTQISSTKFVEYVCKEIIPLVDMDDSSDDQKSSTFVLDTFKTLSELVQYSGLLENMEEKVSSVFELLLEVMPLPPVEAATSEAIEFDVSLEFSRVECLLYLFHKFAADCTEYLNDDQERLKDFRSRLQYFSRGSQAYQKKLRESLKDKKGNELKTEENRMRLIGLKTTANINTLIKDLFHQPPSYKARIVLSWKSDEKGEKRHAPITFDASPNKLARIDRKIYAPPRDKFSRGAGPRRGGGFGRGRSSRGFRRPFGGRY